jgi:hypothetical protein
LQEDKMNTRTSSNTLSRGIGALPALAPILMLAASPAHAQEAGGRAGFHLGGQAIFSVIPSGGDNETSANGLGFSIHLEKIWKNNNALRLRWKQVEHNSFTHIVASHEPWGGSYKEEVIAKPHRTAAPDLSWYPPLALRIRKTTTPICIVYQAFQIAIWHFGLPEPVAKQEVLQLAQLLSRGYFLIAIPNLGKRCLPHL